MRIIVVHWPCVDRGGVGHVGSGPAWTGPDSEMRKDSSTASGSITILPINDWGCPADLLTNQIVLNPKVHGHTSRAAQLIAIASSERNCGRRNCVVRNCDANDGHCVARASGSAALRLVVLASNSFLKTALGGFALTRRNACSARYCLSMSIRQGKGLAAMCVDSW
jgi:hypothetical protein